MSEPETPSARVLELRAHFDRGFAAPPVQAQAVLVDLLAIRAGGVSYALRALDVSQLLAGPRITPLPSPVAQLAGICAVRGVIVPVYDLAALLGHAAGRAPRYVALAMSAEREPLGFAFEELEAQLRVHEDEITPPPENASSSAHRFALVERDGARPVLQLSSLLDAIERRLRQEP